MKKLKVGIIGAGSIADNHIRSYLLRNDVEVTGICDNDPARAEKKAGMYGIRGVYGSCNDLLAQADIDAVSVLTWTSTHEAIVTSALKAGKHVLCEKPPAPDAASAVRMHETAVKSGRLLMYGFVRRFGESERILKEYIDQGRLGGIYYAKTGYIRRCGSPGGWFANKAVSGGGPLIDLGIHMIDLAVYMMGNPKPVSVFGNTYEGLGAKTNIQGVNRYKAADFGSGPDNVEDSANAIVKFDNGASLFVEVGWTMHIKEDKRYLDLCGSRGGASLEPRLELYGDDNNRLMDYHPVLDNAGFDVDQAFAAEIGHFADCILYGEKCICPSEDGVRVMKVIEAVYRSAEAGGLIAFE